MTRKELNNAIARMNMQVIGCNRGNVTENVQQWFNTPFAHVFQYGATSEKVMEDRLAENGRERKSTFMSDLSLAEWVGGLDGVLGTCKRVLQNWISNKEMIAEFVLCVNWKSWEHHARGNKVWTAIYSMLYSYVRDIVYDYYEGDSEGTAYIYEYLD